MTVTTMLARNWKIVVILVLVAMLWSHVSSLEEASQANMEEVAQLRATMKQAMTQMNDMVVQLNGHVEQLAKYQHDLVASLSAKAKANAKPKP